VSPLTCVAIFANGKEQIPKARLIAPPDGHNIGDDPNQVEDGRDQEHGWEAHPGEQAGEQEDATGNAIDDHRADSEEASADVDRGQELQDRKAQQEGSNAIGVTPQSGSHRASCCTIQGVTPYTTNFLTRSSLALRSASHRSY